MKYEIKRINGKPRKITDSGSLSYSLGFAAVAHCGDGIIASLHRPTITLINRDGLVLTGFEQHGTNRNGTVKYKYSEWFCRYLP